MLADAHRARSLSEPRAGTRLSRSILARGLPRPAAGGLALWGLGGVLSDRRNAWTARAGREDFGTPLNQGAITVKRPPVPDGAPCSPVILPVPSRPRKRAASVSPGELL